LIEGILISIDKITKRPSIPLLVLEKESALQSFLNTFDWFIQVVQAL
jgi:hypothetical protein